NTKRKSRLNVENLESRNLLSTTASISVLSPTFQMYYLGSEFKTLTLVPPGDSGAGSGIISSPVSSPTSPTSPTPTSPTPTSPTGPISISPTPPSVGPLGSHQLDTLVTSYAMAYNQSLSSGGGSTASVDSFLNSQKRSFEFSRVTNSTGFVDRVLVTVRSK